MRIQRRKARTRNRRQGVSQLHARVKGIHGAQYFLFGLRVLQSDIVK